jgi:putative cell wall-binding protein
VDVRAELERLNPERIVVLGGPAAVSHEILAQLAQYSPRVDRVAGNDRYATAAAIATSEFAKVNGSVAAAVIATGQNFPDAIAAGAAGFPVLLVPSTGNAPQVVRDALGVLNPLGVIVMGGTAAVSDATLASLGL